MRKIITREEKEKKKQRNQLIIGGILILVMVLSTAGYSFMDRENTTIKKVVYKDIEFVQDDSGYWNFNMNNNAFMTRYNPKETEGINFFVYSSINNFAGKPLYIVSEYNDPNYEIYRNLNTFVSRINSACLNDNCSGDYPIKNCSEDNIIVIAESIAGPDKIYQDSNCIFVNAPIENQTMFTDALLFKILGI
jgi:hypothetical protein